MSEAPYRPRREPTSRFVTLRGLRHHVLQWGEPGSGAAPPLVMLHGWMDVAASFQFVVDAMHTAGDPRCVIAMDWRGFGGSQAPGSDTYWMADYLGDVDALLDALLPDTAVDLLGHSMGGNIVMIYAGVRPKRVRRLINLEGFGMPATVPAMAPRRYEQWLDEIKQPRALLPYPSADAVATRLRKNNPLLPADKAAWLATQWAEQLTDGRWALRADPAHKGVHPILYHVDEALACWKRIEAPLLWVEGDRTDIAKWWGERYTREEFHRRLAVVPRVTKQVLSPAGHMLHHDQPEALAALLEQFLS